MDAVRDPLTGDLFVASLLSGDVRRIRWTGAGGDTPPVAIAAATPDSGSAPLQVSFRVRPAATPMATRCRSCGCSATAPPPTAMAPQHGYTLAGTYSAVLVVDDRRGGITRDTLTIRATSDFAFPTTSLLDRFDRANGPIGPLWQGNTTDLLIDAQRAATRSDPRRGRSTGSPASAPSRRLTGP